MASNHAGLAGAAARLGSLAAGLALSLGCTVPATHDLFDEDGLEGPALCAALRQPASACPPGVRVADVEVWGAQTLLGLPFLDPKPPSAAEYGALTAALLRDLPACEAKVGDLELASVLASSHWVEHATRDVHLMSPEEVAKNDSEARADALRATPRLPVESLHVLGPVDLEACTFPNLRSLELPSDEFMFHMTVFFAP